MSAAQQTPPPQPGKTLTGRLDRLARRGARHLRGWALTQAVEASLPTLFPLSLVVPGALVVSKLVEFSFGSAIWPLGAPATVALAVGVPVAAVAAKILFLYFRHEIDRRMSLALFDRALTLKDRLQTADEFIKSDRPTGFELAAIADAGAAVDRALAAKLDPVRLSSPTLGSARWGFLLLATILLAGGLLIGGASFDGADEEELLVADIEPEPDSALIDPPEVDDVLTAPEFEPVGRVPGKNKPKESQEASTENLESGIPLPGMPLSAERSGTTQSGLQVAAAQQSSSSGAPSGGAEQSAAGKKTPKTGSERKRRKPRPDAEPQDQDDQKKAEASTGVPGGKGGNSGNNPAQSDQPAPENKAQQDEDGDNSEDAEEEEDEEQQGSATQRPSVNQRKAPVDSRLSISGESDQENPDANGRSGPGGLKKTRGVAAMLLAVPLPDRLQGIPNPGRTKTIREQSRPEEEPSDMTYAADRGERDEAVGHVAHRGLLPWMQDLVESYFLTNRAGAAGAQTNGESEADS